MILGAGEGQLPLIKRAKDNNYYTIVVSPCGNYPGFELADRCVYQDVSDNETILSLALEEKIDAIATDQTDVSIPTVQYVAQKIGLPHIKCSNIDNFRVKSKMRMVCEENGIKTPPFFVTDKIEEAHNFLNDLGCATIIKPVDSQGSRGVHKVTEISELEDAFYDAQSYSKSGSVIIEKFIVGQEIEVDSVFKEGNLYATLIGDVFNFGVKDTFSSYERIYPTSYSSEVQRKIVKQNEFIIKTLGLISGWTHGEYVVTPDEDVYLLEVGARGGGNFIGSDIVRIMLGMGTDEMSFLTAIGDDTFYNRISLQDSYCAYKCFYLPSGVVKTIMITPGLLERDFVVCHNLSHIHVGDVIGQNTDKTTRFTIVVKSYSREELSQILIFIEQNIHIKVQTSENVLEGPIWR